MSPAGPNLHHGRGLFLKGVQVAKFYDSHERHWDLSITSIEVKRIRDSLGIDLLEIATTDQKCFDFIFRLGSDAELLIDLISVILTDQILERKMTGEDFASCLGEQGIIAAVDALVHSLAGFMPRERGDLLTANWRASANG